MNTRHIGGSLLPSSDPRILTPVNFSCGTLVVRPLPKEDTHTLILIRDGVETILASHPNGYCCHSLAERIIAGSSVKIAEQIKWILDCGGTSLSIEEILRKIEAQQEQKMKITILPNGNLQMQLTTRGLRKFKKAFKPVNIQTASMEAVFVRVWLVPLGYKQIKPEDCGALTAATLITDGENVWGEMQYAVSSFLETLRAGKPVIWTKG